jgi:hypothetical protein
MLIRVKPRDRGKRIWLEMGPWPADWLFYIDVFTYPRRAGRGSRSLSRLGCRGRQRPAGLAGILLDTTGTETFVFPLWTVVLIVLPPVRVIVAHFSDCGLKHIMVVFNFGVFILGVFNVLRLPFRIAEQQRPFCSRCREVTKFMDHITVIWIMYSWRCDDVNLGQTSPISTHLSWFKSKKYLFPCCLRYMHNWCHTNENRH